LAVGLADRWAGAYRSSRGKNTVYELLCCYINWVNPEKLAELVPLAELALFDRNCREEIYIYIYIYIYI
jgi:hypothetical protein